MVRLPYTFIPGLVSQHFLAEHTKIWDGFVTMLQKAEAGLRAPQDLRESSIASPEAVLKILHDTQTFALNGALLHKLYFENIAPLRGDQTSTPSPELLEAIDKCCAVGGAIGDQLLGASMVSQNGWGLLAVDSTDASLRVTSIKGDDDVATLRQTPLVVLDCWEHAYWGDWGVDRAGYLREAIGRLRWDVASDRYAKALASFKAQVPPT